MPRTRSAAAQKPARSAEPQDGFDADALALLREAGLTEELGFAIRMAELTVFADILERLSGLDITLSQFSVLRLVHAHPGLTQQRIGDALRIRKPNLVALIDKLETRGLVSRTGSATDGRAYALFLTAKGERTLAKAMSAVGEHLQAIRDILSPRDLERALKALWDVALKLR